MDENKYQVIDPDSEKYKLTAKDILDDSKSKKKKKRKKRVLVAFISLFLVFAIVFGTGAVIFNNYLNKMNFGDATGEVDPSIEAEESLEFENQADADADIRANLDDNVLWYDDRIYNILLVGADYGDRKDGKYDNYLTRSDSMILLSINTINNVINEVFPQIATNLSNRDLISLAADIFDYELSENTGFPLAHETPTLGKKGSVVVPADLLSNVKYLHEFLYPEDTEYVPSDEVQRISAAITNETGVYDQFTEDSTTEEPTATNSSGSN